MAHIGRYATLPIVKLVNFGAYLDAGELDTVLLPKRYLTDTMGIGTEVTVFIYLDSNDIPVATTVKPFAQVGQTALLKVVDINNTGAFLDWGLPKHLLVPYKEQHRRFELGQSYLVSLYLDPYSKRIVGSSRLSRHLKEDGRDLNVNDKVDLLIGSKSDLGFKAVINQEYLGLIFHDEVFRPVHYGQKTHGYIKAIRPDGKIDVSLQPLGDKGRDRLQQKIMDYLQQSGGRSTVTDKSDPLVISQQFGVSKGAYKKALGALYKQRLIIITPDEVRLAE